MMVSASSLHKHNAHRWASYRESNASFLYSTKSTTIQCLTQYLKCSPIAKDGRQLAKICTELRIEMRWGVEWKLDDLGSLANENAERFQGHISRELC